VKNKLLVCCKLVVATLNLYDVVRATPDLKVPHIPIPLFKKKAKGMLTIEMYAHVGMRI
jgi:hypothetical protein